MRYDYSPEQLVTRVHETDPFPVEPWIMITNSWDFLHLRELHGLELEVDDFERRLERLAACPVLQEHAV